MILEVQIQNFGTEAGACALKFSVKKIPGGLNNNIFCENWHEALPFTLKLKCNKKIRSLSFKNYYFVPPKNMFLVFEKNTRTNFFSLCFCSDFKTIDAQMFF